MEGLRLFPLIITSLLPAIVVCVLLPVILLRKARLRSKMPPGPRALPIIGHLHLLGKNPHHSLHNLSKIHGPLMSLRLGSVPLIVASTPDMAQQILQTHDQTFSAHPQMAVPTLLHGCSDILFALPGPHWNFMRRLCMNELFSKKRLEFFRPVRTAEVGALMRSILNAVGKPIALRAELHAVATNIISRMALGKRLSELATTSQADPSHNIVTLTLEMNDLLGIFNVSDYIPCLAWMDLQGCARRSKAVARKLNIVLQEVIDGRRDSRDGSDGSMLEVLLLASLNSTRKNIQITDHKIKAVLMNMFGGGIDTSSITIEWAIAELFANPTKMKMVEEELERVVGTTRLVQESDIPHLLYLQAVVKETMRLHPVVPLLVPHISSQPCQISGYHIPANTLAYVNVWAIGRDANTWEKPLEFCPERFLDSNMDVNGQHFELLPFGSGRRGCPGWTLGLLTVQIILASLLHGFNWTTIEKLDVSDKFGLVLTLSNPLIAKATPKLSTHLFDAQK